MRRLLATFIVLALALVPFTAPTVAAKEATTPEAVYDRELVVFDVDSQGKIKKTTLLDSLTIFGNGRVTIRDPGATQGLRNLYGYEKPKAAGGQVLWDVDVEGTKEVLSASTTDKKSPVALSSRYFLNGKAISPARLVGKSGRVTVEYRLRNTTGKKETLEFVNSSGAKTSGPIETYVPLVGQVEFQLPASRWSQVAAPGGQVTTDERNVHHVTYSTILAPLFGSVDQTIRLEARVENFELSGTRAVFIPLIPESVNATATRTSDSTQKLLGGIGQVDSNLQKLYAGTLLLMDGLDRLYRGILEAKTGVGAVGQQETMVDGLKRVLDGLKQLGDTNQGIPAAKAGVDGLTAGVQQVITALGSSASPNTVLYGLDKLEGGLATLSATAAGSLTTIKSGIDATNAGVGTIAAGVGTANGVVGADPGFGSAGGPGLATSANNDVQFVRQILGCATGLESPTCAVLAGINAKLSGVNAGLAGAAAGLTGSVQPGLTGLSAGTLALSGGLTAAIGTPATDPATTLRGGLAAVTGGVTLIRAGMSSGNPNDPKVLEGLQAVGSGLSRAVAGIGTVGTPQTLTGGTNRLFEGSTELASGLDQIARGTFDASSGAQTIGAGQQALSAQGTQALATGVGGSVEEASRAVALIAAMQRRAQTDAFLYGPPEGATGSTTYVYNTADLTREQQILPVQTLLAIAMLIVLIVVGTRAMRQEGIQAARAQGPRRLVPGAQT